MGAKVNGGTVTHMMKDGKHVLTLSDDFKVPDTPDPHWQVVDSKGQVYLLQRLGPRTWAASRGPHQHVDHTAGVHPRCRESADLLRMGRRPSSARPVSPRHSQRSLSSSARSRRQEARRLPRQCAACLVITRRIVPGACQAVFRQMTIATAPYPHRVAGHHDSS